MVRRSGYGARLERQYLDISTFSIVNYKYMICISVEKVLLALHKFMQASKNKQEKLNINLKLISNTDCKLIEFPTECH